MGQEINGKLDALGADQDTGRRSDTDGISTSSGRTRDLRYRLYPIAAVTLFIALWEVFVQVRDIAPIFLPAPSAIAMRLAEMVVDGTLLIESGLTLARILGGFLIAAISGVALGLLMGMYRSVSSIADLFIAALYPLPKIALIPLLIIWLGSGEAYKIAISALSAFFPIVINTYQGVREVDPGLIKTAKNLGAGARDLQIRVIVPGSLPFILAGFRLGMGVAFILVVAAEMVAGSDGLGYVLFYSGQILRTDRVFAVLIVLAILGWLITRLQQRVDRAIAPWARVYG